jgi:choline monooxygenase
MHSFFIDPDITMAKTLHTDFYTDPGIFEMCREKIFAGSWQFIGSTDLVPKKGDAFPFILLEKCLDEPLLLLQDSEENLLLLSNVCTHRGNLLAYEACNISSIRCRYHGRQFGLDGKFMFMPEFREVRNFPAAEDDLKSLEMFKWEKFLFTSVGHTLPPELFFKDMMERVNWMPLKDFVFKPGLSREFSVKANWAIYCENYLEGFHIPFVHEDLNSVIDFGSYVTELYFPYSSLQVGLSKKREGCFDLPESSPDYGQMVAAYYFWVFPNMMFNFYPWGLSVNIVQPVSAGECKISFRTYVWDESKMGVGAGTGLDKVEMEDEEIVENVQKGVRSRFYRQGRYSATREKGTHHFHRILSEFIKPELP